MKLLFHGIGAYLEGGVFGACWPHHDLLVVQEGEVSVKTPKGRVNLPSGDVIWIPPRLKFQGLVSSERARMWVIHFRDRTLRPSGYTSHFAAGLGLFRGGANSDLARQLMERLHHVYRGDGEWPLQAAAYLPALLVEMSRNREMHADADRQWLRPLEQWAREELRHGVGVRDLAGHAKLSESHFRKLFRQRAKVSAGRFLHDLRLKEAKELLQHSVLSLKEVGARAGYADAVAFHHAFSARYHTTPGEFRKAMERAI